jgi:NTE family protein
LRIERVTKGSVARGSGSRGSGPRVPRPRVALVFGAGGVLGAAWMTGALPALQELLPCPLGEADLIVGTSAGSVIAAALRCHVGIDEMVGYQRGEPIAALTGADLPDVAVGAWPPPPQWLVGSPKLMLAAVRAPHRMHPWVGASALLPRGRAKHAGLHALVRAMHAAGPPDAGPVPADWVTGETWIVAVDYDSGRRVFFGRDGAPPARLPDAVVASCSIPGWYEPTVIGGRRYIDGGVRSATSLRAVARAGMDEVFVLAPMASLVADRPVKPIARMERRLRHVVTTGLLRDATALESAGIRVHILTPGPEDLAVIGVNLMDPRRRQAVVETALRTSREGFTCAGGARAAAA